MPEPYVLRKFDDATPAEIEAALEHSDVVYFERCPICLFYGTNCRSSHGSRTSATTLSRIPCRVSTRRRMFSDA